MVVQESKDLIVKYIKQRGGKATKNNVVRYMTHEAFPKIFRISRVPTLEVIDELEKSDRIKVLRGKRPGQSHRLIVNDNSDFDRINDHLSRTQKFIEEPNQSRAQLKARQDWVIKDLMLELMSAEKYIKNESDLRVLNQRIIDLMLKIGHKTMRSVFTE